ncbi:hypothetical protein ILYODFUR_031869, partial [Ilyodon furcidens]
CVALMVLPQQMMEEEITLSTTEDMQDHAANTKRHKLPQEVQSVLYLLVNGFMAASPLQPAVQTNTEVFIILQHLHFFSNDGNSVAPIPVSLKIYNHLIHVQDEMIVATPFHKAV